MKMQDTTVEIRDNAYETIPACGWGWPDEARLTDFAEKDYRMKQADRTIENDPEYATLYFVS
jgi:hypothetical protein